MRTLDIENRIGRHIDRRMRIPDPEDPERYIGTSPDAFLPSSRDDGLLSMGWLGYHPAGSIAQQADATLTCMNRVRGVHQRDVLGVLTIAQIASAAAVLGRTVSAVHDSLDHACHTSVGRFELDDLLVAQRLAEMAELFYPGPHHSRRRTT